MPLAATDVLHALTLLSPKTLMLTGIFRGFPLILQTQTIVCFVCDDFLQHADSLHIAQERSKKGDIKEGLLRLKWFK